MRANRASIGLKRVAAMVLSSVLTVTALSAQTPQPSGVTERKSDSVLNGALFGAGTAVASGLVFCTLMEPWDNCRDDVGPMIKIGAIGAGIGMGVDALIRKKIYQSAAGGAEVHATPVFGRRAKGVRLSVRF